MLRRKLCAPRSRFIPIALLLTMTSFIAGCSGTGKGAVPYAASADGAGKNHVLIYVSSKDKDSVYVYSFPKYRSPILIINVSANGLCSGPGGNVWMSTTGTSGGELVEYARGSGSVLEELPAATPGGCAVDAKSGDLAVANTGTTSVPGSLAIYQENSTKPRIYADRMMPDPEYCAYDGNGDVFVVGESSGTHPTVGVAELKKGAKSLRSIALGETAPAYPGALAWDGQYMVFSDRNITAFYRYSIVKGKPSFVDRVDFPVFEENYYGTIGFAVYDGQLVMNIANGRFNLLDNAPYPAGGYATRQRLVGDATDSLALSIP